MVGVEVGGSHPVSDGAEVCKYIYTDFFLCCGAQVKFEIPYFTVSGIQVRYLKIIEKSGYQALPWVR